MGFIDSIKSFFLKAFDFRTRSSRSEFWYPHLAQILFFSLFLIPPSFLFLDLLGSVLSYLFILPEISLNVRRLHDVGMSVWWLICYPLIILLILIPPVFNSTFVGVFIIPLILSLIIIWIYLMCKKGDVRDNKYGPDPLALVKKKIN